jgi:hypothetical protein
MLAEGVVSRAVNPKPAGRPAQLAIDETLRHRVVAIREYL